MSCTALLVWNETNKSKSVIPKGIEVIVLKYLNLRYTCSVICYEIIHF